MTRIGLAVAGVIATSLTLGVAFASTNDNAKVVQSASNAQSAAVVNRDAKGNRGTVLVAAAKEQTLSFRITGLSDTSAAVRVPHTMLKLQDASSTATQPSRRPQVRFGSAKIACEPMVSVLTEVAKKLEPGRCLS